MAICCGLIAWLLLAADPAAAVKDGQRPVRVIHVSPNGDDKADGSAGAPLRTLRRALQIAERGDVVTLAAGIYQGGVTTRVPGVQVHGVGVAVIRGPERDRAIEILHSETVLRGLTIERADIGIWLYGVDRCVLEDLQLRDLGGEGIRIKNQSSHNLVRRCNFERMGRTGFDVTNGKKNGEGIYIGTAPEQRAKNSPPNVPDQSCDNLIEDCVFATDAAEAVDIKEDSERNVVRNCQGKNSRDPDGAIFGARGDSNRFENCIARDGAGHGFRFGGDTVVEGKYGQPTDRVYGAHNVMRNCRGEQNAAWGVAAMVKPQDIDASNTFARNGRGEQRP